MIDRYKLGWLALQLLVSIYDIFFRLWLRLHALLFWSYDLWHDSVTITRRDHAFLQRCKAELTKLPRHLNLIIGPENYGYINDIDISRILQYAYVIGIEFVSLYDVRSENIGRIVIGRLKTPPGVYQTEIQPHHYVWHTEQYTSTSRNKRNPEGNVNGYVSGVENGRICKGSGYRNTHLEIYQLRDQDNRKSIAEICRKLFQQRNTSDVQYLLTDRKLLEERINYELSQYMHWKFVDPELSIIFNAYACTFGMLPWQTRFTEFHNFETGRCMNAKKFAEILYRYSKCEQRWGK